MTGRQLCFGFEFPLQISIYERDDETLHDYESHAPGYGYSCGYVIPEITSRTMTAYIYDRGRNDIPNGIANLIARDEYYQSTLEAFSNKAFYSNLVMTNDGSCGYDAGRRFYYAAVTFTNVKSGEPRASLVAVTTWRGKFFKVRITRTPGVDAEKEMTHVVEAWAEYLWAIDDS